MCKEKTYGFVDFNGRFPGSTIISSFFVGGILRGHVTNIQISIQSMLVWM